MRDEESACKASKSSAKLHRPGRIRCLLLTIQALVSGRESAQACLRCGLWVLPKKQQGVPPKYDMIYLVWAFVREGVGGLAFFGVAFVGPQRMTLLVAVLNDFASRLISQATAMQGRITKGIRVIIARK